MIPFVCDNSELLNLNQSLSEKKSDRLDINQMKTVDIDGDYGYQPNIQTKQAISRTMDNTTSVEDPSSQNVRIIKTNSHAKVNSEASKTKLAGQGSAGQVNGKIESVEEYLNVAEAVIQKEDLSNITTQRTQLRGADQVVVRSQKKTPPKAVLQTPLP